MKRRELKTNIVNKTFAVYKRETKIFLLCNNINDRKILLVLLKIKIVSGYKNLVFFI